MTQLDDNYMLNVNNNETKSNMMRWNSLDNFIFFSAKTISRVSRYKYKIFNKFMSNFDNFIFIKQNIEIKNRNILENFCLKLKEFQVFFISISLIKNLYENLISNEIKYDKELMDLDTKSHYTKKRKKSIYNLYFRLYSNITSLFYRISTRILLKSNNDVNKYQSLTAVNITGYFDFMVYRISDLNLLNYLYFSNFSQKLDYNFIYDDIGCIEFHYFQRIEKTLFLDDFLKIRFFRFFKHHYNVDVISKKLRSLNIADYDMKNNLKFYFLLLNSVKGFNYCFLIKIFYLQMRYFKKLRLNFYFKFFTNIFNVDFFFFKLYKYILYIYKNSFIKSMHIDFILNNKINKHEVSNSFISDFLEHFAIPFILPNFWYNTRFINFSIILKKKPYKLYRLYFYYTLYNAKEYVFFKIFKDQSKIKQNKYFQSTKLQFTKPQSTKLQSTKLQSTKLQSTKLQSTKLQSTKQIKITPTKQIKITKKNSIKFLSEKFKSLRYVDLSLVK